MHDLQKAKITDKTFRDDHRDINKLLANNTGNDNPIKDDIGAHNLPFSCVPTAGGRVFTRDNKQTKDNKSPKYSVVSNSINSPASLASKSEPRPPDDVRRIADSGFFDKRRRMLSTPTASTVFYRNAGVSATNLLHNPDRGRNNLNAQANSVCPDAPCGIGSPMSWTWLSRLFHPPET
jgi:hypothetical protein